MLGETQRNVGVMEKSGPWGNYVCFFSTGIDPKKREANEKRKELAKQQAEEKTLNTNHMFIHSRLPNLEPNQKLAEENVEARMMLQKAANKRYAYQTTTKKLRIERKQLERGSNISKMTMIP